MVRRTIITLLAAVALVAGVTTPANASAPDKAAILLSWTQTGAASYDAWNAARTDQEPWERYNFDWSTDLCSSSPDNPLGFDFRLSCHRHDFGYRNYKAANDFPANKGRIDDAFYADLKRRCQKYNAVVRPACLSLAWTYYQAVKQFGSLAAVRQSDLDRAAAMLP
jgi:hypothetical protein